VENQSRAAESDAIADDVARALSEVGNSAEFVARYLLADVLARYRGVFVSQRRADLVGSAFCSDPNQSAMQDGRNMTQISVICSVCGSTNVSRDAWAAWDIEAQAWTLQAVFDQGHCHRCEQDRRLEETNFGDLPQLSIT